MHDHYAATASRMKPRRCSERFVTLCDFAAAKIGRKIDVWYATEFMRKLRLFLSFLLSAYPAFSWGPEGHNLVARLAAAHLNPAAAAQVKAILGPGASPASVSSWADQVRSSRRETAPWRCDRRCPRQQSH